MQKKEKIKFEESEPKILRALFTVFTRPRKITLAKAAQDENIPVHFLLKYASNNGIPIIDDNYEALRRIVVLMQQKNIGWRTTEIIT